MIHLVIYKRRGVWRVARLQRTTQFEHVSFVNGAWWSDVPRDHAWWVRLVRSNVPERWQKPTLTVAANFAFLKPRCLMVGLLVGGERGVEQFEALLADHLRHLGELKKVGRTKAASRVRRQHFMDCCKLSLSCLLDSLDRVLTQRAD